MFNGCKHLQSVSLRYTKEPVFDDNVNSYKRITFKGEWKSICDKMIWSPIEKTNMKAIIIESIEPPLLTYFCGFFVGNITVNNAIIYVPDISLSLYHKAKVWRDYKDYIKPLSEYQE